MQCGREPPAPSSLMPQELLEAVPSQATPTTGRKLKQAGMEAALGPLLPVAPAEELAVVPVGGPIPTTGRKLKQVRCLAVRRTSVASALQCNAALHLLAPPRACRRWLGSRPLRWSSFPCLSCP